MIKISWITTDALLDVDLPIINQLQNSYNINWQILVKQNNNIDYENYVDKIIKNKRNLKITFIYVKYRSRSLKNIKVYLNIIDKAKNFSPNLYYISLLGIPYAAFLYNLLLPINKCIVACHNVTTPKGGSSEFISRFYIGYILKRFKNIHVFSNNQKKVLENKYSNKNILMTPLAIKDYGEPSIKLDKIKTNIIRFLSFGNIVEYKRIDLLINAGNLLFEKGINNFKICIAGNCPNWENKYASLIKYPEIFDLYIKRIPNEDVADLFGNSHYFVMPYQDIAQSGAITVAFRYNLPTLVSNLEQFNEFVQDNVNGLMFQSENVEDLAEKMLYLIENHRTLYPLYTKAQIQYVDTNLSLNSIVNKYEDYLNNL